MTKAKFTKPTNRLSWRAGLKGLARDDAVSRANKNVRAIEPAIIADLDENLFQLNAIFIAKGGDAAPPIADFYRYSDNMAAIAGVCGLNVLGRAAFNFCELLSEFERLAYWSPEPIKIYLDALRLLRQMCPLSQEVESTKILDDISLLLEYFRSKEIYS